MISTEGNRKMSIPRLLALSALVLASVFGAVSAEPYIAVRTGFKCSQCHVNRTGGGMRTDYGLVYSQYKLLMATAVKDSASSSFDPKLNGAVSLGSNFRVEQIRFQEFAYDTSVAKSKDMTSIRESNLYVNLELIKGFLNLYLDQTVAPVTANREMFAQVNLPLNSYFKFGNTLLPYGFRLMDNEAFVRSNTKYTYDRVALSYEAGFEPGPVSLVANINEATLSAVGSFVFKEMPLIRTFRLGGSYSTPIKKKERDTDNHYGVFGGFALGMFTFLGERDWSKKGTVNSIADYAEMDVIPRQGLNFKFVYEYLWPDKNVPSAQNGQRRITVGVEPFVTQFLQVGLYYRRNEWIPQALAVNQDQILGRLHVFF